MAGRKTKTKQGKKKGKGKRSNKRAGAPRNGGFAVGGYTIAKATSGVPRPVFINRDHITCCECLSNPFDKRCEGMKLPDGMNGRSVPLTIHFTTNVKADANGFAALQVLPQLPFCFGTFTDGAASLYTANNWLSTGVPSIFTNNADGYRIVCYGVKITFPSNVTQCAGNVIINTMDRAIKPAETTTSGLFIGNESTQVPVAAGEQFIWIGKPQGPRIFVNQNNNANFADVGAMPFTSLFLDMNGAVASSTVMQVECIYHIEIALNNAGLTAGLQALAPRDPLPMPAAIAAAGVVANRTPSLHSGPEDEVRKKLMAEVRAALGNVAGAAVRSGAAYLSGGG